MKPRLTPKVFLFAFSICVLTLFVQSESTWNCDTFDRALIKIVVSNQSVLSPSIKRLDVKFQYIMCANCDYRLLKSVNYIKDTKDESTLDSFYKYKFQVTYMDSKTNSTAIFCDRFDYQFGECGQYVLKLGSMNECSFQMIAEPIDSDKYLYIALAVVIILIIISNVIEYFGLFKKLLRLRDRIFAKIKNRKATSNDTDQLKTKNDKANGEVQGANSVPKKKTRLLSLDTFRGLSLVFMIVINYGSGEYKVIKHKPWHGITIADFVFPWFLWIMGVSIVLSTNNQLRKPGTRKLDIFFKIVVRFLKLFAIGIMLNSKAGVPITELRILGVLQRIALSYIVVAVVELVCYRSIDVSHDELSRKRWTYYLMDIIWPWKQWIIMLIIFTSWFLITFLLDVPGCGRGYLGPGGMDGYGKYARCNGGAAGYVDVKVLGYGLIHKRPTSKEIFQLTDPFDPEGIMGTFNSIILTFLGVQAGRILVFYESHLVRIIKWGIWTIVTLVLFLALTQADLENGLIPVNKNLWTPTYTFFTATTASALLIIFYVLIDMKKWWSGNPFIYPGMNSILIYTCHSIFRYFFPIYVIVATTHGPQLAIAVWGSIFWTLVSMYLYHKRIFVNL